MKQGKKLIWLAVLVAILLAINFWPRSARPDTQKGASKKGQAPGLTYDIPDATFSAGEDETVTGRNAADVTRNIFQYGRGTPTQTTPRVRTATASPPPTPPPPAPEPKPPLRFFGFAQGSASGAQRAFLTDGELVFVAREGDVVMQRYKVLQIQDKSVSIQDSDGGRQWVLPLEQP